MVRGIVFDMDGVIINSHPAHRQAWQQFLAMFGKRVSDNDLDFILEGRKRQDILRHFLGDLSDSELHDYGKKKDELFQKMCDSVLPISGVVDFLRDLEDARVPVAVATSASQRRTSLTLERLGLVRYFKTVITGDHVAEGKPNPAIYLLAAHHLKLPADSLLALEDAPGGVEAAISAGMRCVGIADASNAHKLHQAGAEYVIPDFIGTSLERLESILNQTIINKRTKPQSSDPTPLPV